MKTNNPKIHLPAILLWALLLLSTVTFAEDQKDYAPYPQPDDGYVTDLANLLTPEQEQRLEELIYKTEERYGFEMAVVTIESIRDYPGTANRSIESFATGLFNTYGIGNMPKNDGVLLLVAVKDRKARIELGAYYGRSRDSDANRIMQRVILPQFKKDRYDKGIIKGTHAILKEFRGVWVIPDLLKLAFILILAAAIVSLIPITFSLIRNGKRGWGWVCAGLIIILSMVLLRILVKMILSRGSMGVGGYGGGFGGGSSGGGGATGSW